MVKQSVGSMSGGEKARLVLCMIVWQRPNLLLLDEPTNHLDLATREALSVALNEFEGSVMLVSRSEEHTSELQSLMRISYAVFCLKKKKHHTQKKKTPKSITRRNTEQ